MNRNLKVSYKEKSNQPATVVNLSSIFNMIKNEHPVFNAGWFDKLQSLPETEAKAAKRELPMFYMVEFDGKAIEDNIIGSNGFICLDIDSKELAAIASEKLKFLMKYTVLRFRSPRGGLKWILRTSVRTMNPDEFKRAWNSFNDKITDKFGSMFDKSCCNIGHSCYISYDPDAYWNPEASCLRIDIPEAGDKSVPMLENREKVKQVSDGSSNSGYGISMVYDEKRANKFITTYDYTKLQGTRYATTQKAVSAILFAGATDYQVVELMQRMKSTGHLDRDITEDTFMNKAKEFRKFWESGKNTVNEYWFKKQSVEKKDVVSEFSKIFADKIKEAEAMGF